MMKTRRKKLTAKAREAKYKRAISKLRSCLKDMVRCARDVYLCDINDLDCKDCTGRCLAKRWCKVYASTRKI